MWLFFNVTYSDFFVQVMATPIATPMIMELITTYMLIPILTEVAQDLSSCRVSYI